MTGPFGGRSSLKRTWASAGLGASLAQSRCVRSQEVDRGIDIVHEVPERPA